MNFTCEFFRIHKQYQPSRTIPSSRAQVRSDYVDIFYCAHENSPLTLFHVQKTIGTHRLACSGDKDNCPIK